MPDVADAADGDAGVLTRGNASAASSASLGEIGEPLGLSPRTEPRRTSFTLSFAFFAFTPTAVSTFGALKVPRRELLSIASRTESDRENAASAGIASTSTGVLAWVLEAELGVSPDSCHRRASACRAASRARVRAATTPAARCFAAASRDSFGAVGAMAVTSGVRPSRIASAGIASKTSSAPPTGGGGTSIGGGAFGGAKTCGSGALADEVILVEESGGGGPGGGGTMGGGVGAPLGGGPVGGGIASASGALAAHSVAAGAEDADEAAELGGMGAGRSSPCWLFPPAGLMALAGLLALAGLFALS